MLTQPLIMHFAGGAWQPLEPDNWHLATQTGTANALEAALKALGVSDARVVNMAAYTDAQGNFHNDVYGMFQYIDPVTRFYAVMGTLKLNAGTPNEVDVPIYEPAGRLWDRQAQPDGFFDKIAPIIIGGNQNPFPNGAHLKIQAYPKENYATLYWDANT